MRRLLIVEDEQIQIEILKNILKSIDVEIESANSVDEAFRLFQDHPFHAILSDFNMPGSTGIDLLRRLRSAGNDVPFIILTGWGSQDMVTQALRLGATDLLEKPFETKEIIEVVDQALQIGYRTARIRDLTRQTDFGPTELGRIEHEQKMISVIKSIRTKR